MTTRRGSGANAGKGFRGGIVLGMGFIVDDADSKGVATPLPEMRRLIVVNTYDREAFLPLIGGEEVNSGPTHAHIAMPSISSTGRFVEPIRARIGGMRTKMCDGGGGAPGSCRSTVPNRPDPMAVMEERVKSERRRGAPRWRDHQRSAIMRP